jgi:acetate kinase
MSRCAPDSFRNTPTVPDAILVLNAGSSSIKFCVYDAARSDVLLRGQIQGIGTGDIAASAPPARFDVRDGFGAPLISEACAPDLDHARAIGRLLDFLAARPDMRLVGAGHRVVHGGARYAAPVRITRAVVADLTALVPLAPLHQPHNVAAIEALSARAPELPQVACFDTAFHATQPPVAQAFGLPPRITDRGVRRYGFHGLSYEFVADALRLLNPDAARGRTIVAHLGNGASMCALLAGRSIATTMGFTPLDGLMMGTRAGALDPGVLLHLQTALRLSVGEVEQLLYYGSGLLGVSGISADMRTLLATDDPRAAFAVELFCYRAVREIGSLTAALGGVDALVFTGGIGEHAAPIRARIADGCAWLGAALDPDANAAHAARISTAQSRLAMHVAATDEERMILRHTVRLLAGDAGVP